MMKRFTYVNIKKLIFNLSSIISDLLTGPDVRLDRQVLLGRVATAG